MRRLLIVLVVFGLSFRAVGNAAPCPKHEKEFKNQCWHHAIASYFQCLEMTGAARVSVVKEEDQASPHKLTIRLNASAEGLVVAGAGDFRFENNSDLKTARKIAEQFAGDSQKQCLEAARTLTGGSRVTADKRRGRQTSKDVRALGYAPNCELQDAMGRCVRCKRSVSQTPAGQLTALTRQYGVFDLTCANMPPGKVQVHAFGTVTATYGSLFIGAGGAYARIRLRTSSDPCLNKSARCVSGVGGPPGPLFFQVASTDLVRSDRSAYATLDTDLCGVPGNHTQCIFGGDASIVICSAPFCDYDRPHP